TSIPLAGATVTVADAHGPIATTVTDSRGTYAFVNLTCGPCNLSVRMAGTIVALPPTFGLGHDPSTTTVDIVTGAEQSQLFLSGRVLPSTDAGPGESNVAVRVYRG